MFYYLNGTLAHKGERFVVVDVGGVGFKVYTSAENLSKMLTNSQVKLFTYMNIREDLMDIYGFLSHEELEFFELLISVSGVGPRAAISILSTLTVDEIVSAVISDDPKTISRAQGVGVKTAGRIILELSDKVGSLSYDGGGAVEIPSVGGKNEAVSALMALGYTDRESREAVAKTAEGLDTESIIKEALKGLMR